MRIYTKTGDKGETRLYGGRRVLKDSLRIEAYGSVDELNSALGVIRALKPGKKIDLVLRRVQDNLFVLGADLATPAEIKKPAIPRINSHHTRALEKDIDNLEAMLPALKNFLLPGGSLAAAHLHLARTICRRAERWVVRLFRTERTNAEALVYLNRLSDLLFVLARTANRLRKKKETPWIKPS